jgi:hypothetical protein
MASDKFEIATPIENFVDTRLKKKNSEKRRHKHLHEVHDPDAGMEIGHVIILALFRPSK